MGCLLSICCCCCCCCKTAPPVSHAYTIANGCGKSDDQFIWVILHSGSIHFKDVNVGSDERSAYAGFNLAEEDIHETFKVPYKELHYIRQSPFAVTMMTVIDHKGGVIHANMPTWAGTSYIVTAKGTVVLRQFDKDSWTDMTGKRHYPESITE